MSSVKQLSHVCLGTPDLTRTIEFYKKMLGCEVAHEFRNPDGELYGAFLSCGNDSFLEFFKEWAPRERGGAFRHVCFDVENIEKMADSVNPRPEIKRGRTDNILQFVFPDPDGNTIEIHQRLE